MDASGEEAREPMARVVPPHWQIKGTETGQLPSFSEIRRVAVCNPADLDKRWKLSRLGTLHIIHGLFFWGTSVSCPGEVLKVDARARDHHPLRTARP